MKEPTDGQIKEFWEWCGLRYESYNTPAFPYQGGAWVYADGIYANPDEPMELPSIDLNSLFEYAVPRVCFGVDLEMCPNDKWRAGIKLISDGIKYAKGDTPALALFWAIYEVIK